jgi:hypothetical protein
MSTKVLNETLEKFECYKSTPGNDTNKAWYEGYLSALVNYELLNESEFELAMISLNANAQMLFDDIDKTIDDARNKEN